MKVSNYFDSRDLFFNKFPISDSKQAKNIIKTMTRERGEYDPIASALLNLVSALFCYNSSMRVYTQRAVALENSVYGLNKIISYGLEYVEEHESVGLIYTIFWLSGHQQLGEALIVARDLLDNIPTNSDRWNRESFDSKRSLNVLYDLTYLGLYLSPRGHSFLMILKISKVAYFVFNEYSQCSLCWDRIQNRAKEPKLANTINLLAEGIRLYGNSLQLYTTGNAIS